MLLGLVNPFGLSVLDTVKISTPAVSCGASGSCSVTLTVTNNNATSNFAVYMKVQNSRFQTVWQNTIQVQSAVSTFTTPSLPLGTLSLGAYIFSAFAVSNFGVSISQTTSTAFNVGGKYQLTIAPVSTVSGSITPSCTHSSPCNYEVGSKVTVTYTPATNYKFAQWTILPIFSDGRTGTPSTSKDNPLALTMEQNYELILDVTAPTILYFEIIPTISATGGCNEIGSSLQSCEKGTIDPSGSTRVYESSAFGSPTATFTATPKTNLTFSNWQINDKNFTANPVTLTYADLKPLQTSSGQAQFHLYAYFRAKIFWQLGIGTYSGITTNPAAKNSGTYTYPAGTQVTVSVANVADNVCFTGWLVDGKDVGSGDSVTVTMDGYHSVFAQGIGKPSEGCDGVADDGGGGEVGLSGPSIPITLVGGMITVLGFVLNRRKH
mgnify:FL=1